MVLLPSLHLVGACASPTRDSASRAGPSEVTLSGHLHVVWNGEPSFFLVDEGGASLSLFLPEDTEIRPASLLALDQRPVRVTGVRVSPDSVRVTNVRPGTPTPGTR